VLTFNSHYARFLQHGSDKIDVCCLDLTGNSTSTGISFMGLSDWHGSFIGQLQNMINYWSDMPIFHNDASYSQFMTNCTLGKGECNKQIMMAWESTPVAPGNYGIRFGSGRGKYLAGPSGLQHALLSQGISAQMIKLVKNNFTSSNIAGESLKCVVAMFSTDSKLKNKIPDNRCINLEEGLALISQATNLSQKFHPILRNEQSEVPECSKAGTCTFTGIKDPDLGEFKSDTPNRWAQICDFYSVDFTKRLGDIQGQCNAEKGCPQSRGGAD
jgi:hypothetical protein